MVKQERNTGDRAAVREQHKVDMTQRSRRPHESVYRRYGRSSMQLTVNGETFTTSGKARARPSSFSTFRGFSYQWRHQIAALKDRFTCIAFDHRGFGHSTFNGRWDVPTGLASQGADGCLGRRRRTSSATRWEGRSRSRSRAVAGHGRSLILVDTFAKNHTHSKRASRSPRSAALHVDAGNTRGIRGDAAAPETPQSSGTSSVRDLSGEEEAYLDVLRGIRCGFHGALREGEGAGAGSARHDKTTPVEFTNDLTRLIPARRACDTHRSLGVSTTRWSSTSRWSNSSTRNRADCHREERR